MDGQVWTIDRIGDALRVPALRQRFLEEIGRAPACELLAVFARWKAIAESIARADERGRRLVAQAGPDGELPGEWFDITDELRERAERFRGGGGVPAVG